MHARGLESAGHGGVSAMKNWRHMALHAAAAATFMYLLQRYALHSSYESASLWALVFGACAAALAYSQSNR